MKRVGEKANQLEGNGLGSSEEVIRELQEAGYRITRCRRAIIAMFFVKTAPLAAQEILKRLKAMYPSVNKTTVYRELHFLRERGIIDEIDLLDGHKRYERRRHHHHHVICTSCSAVECIDECLNMGELYRRVKAKSKFTIKDHVLEFFGICGSCLGR